MKTFWITAGIGVLMVAIGGAIYLMSDHQWGVILILSGFVIGILGFVMRWMSAYMDKPKSAS